MAINAQLQKTNKIEIVTLYYAVPENIQCTPRRPMEIPRRGRGGQKPNVL